MALKLCSKRLLVLGDTIELSCAYGVGRSSLRPLGALIFKRQNCNCRAIQLFRREHVIYIDCEWNALTWRIDLQDGFRQRDVIPDTTIMLPRPRARGRRNSGRFTVIVENS
jgi:hypothetical protein